MFTLPVPEGDLNGVLVITPGHGQIVAGGVITSKATQPEADIKGWTVSDLKLPPAAMVQNMIATTVRVLPNVVAAVRATLDRIGYDAEEATKVEQVRRLGCQDAIRAMMQEALAYGNGEQRQR